MGFAVDKVVICALMVILMEMIVIGVCLAIGFLTYNVCRKKTKSAGEGSLDEKDLDEAYWYS